MCYSRTLQKCCLEAQHYWSLARASVKCASSSDIIRILFIAAHFFRMFCRIHYCSFDVGESRDCLFATRSAGLFYFWKLAS